MVIIDSKFSYGRRLIWVSLLLVLSVVLSTRAATATPENSGLCAISKDAIQQASKIRGLKIKKQVPCFLHDKEQVKSYLLSTLDSKIPAQKLDHESLVYKAIGLIPMSFDYKSGLVKMYLDQLGGYYDPESDHYVMASWLPSMMQVAVAVHELTHALQDQHFDLEKFTDVRKEVSDVLMARSALLEGDATAVMIDYTRALIGQEPISKEKDVTSFMLQNIWGAGAMTAGSDVPEGLKLMLIFPYTSGLRFVHTLLQKGGYAEIDRAFRRSPRSSEEILHPEKFFDEKGDFINISAVKDPFASDGATLNEVYHDVLGEFAVSALFSGFIADRKRVAEAAAGWGGDRISVLEVGAKKDLHVVWQTHWDTANDANQFFDLYHELLSIRSKSGAPIGTEIDQRATVEDGAELLIERSGQNVTIAWRAPVA